MRVLTWLVILEVSLCFFGSFTNISYATFYARSGGFCNKFFNWCDRMCNRDEAQEMVDSLDDVTKIDARRFCNLVGVTLTALNNILTEARITYGGHSRTDVTWPVNIWTGVLGVPGFKETQDPLALVPTQPGYLSDREIYRIVFQAAVKDIDPKEKLEDALCRARRRRN